MKRNMLILSLIAFALFCDAIAQTSDSPGASKSGQPSATVEALIAAQERETWDAMKRHDPAAFARLCLEECVEIYGDGQVLTVQDVLAQEPDTEIKEFQMEEVKVSVLNEKTAIIRYKVLAKVTYKGEENPARWMLASAVWVKRGNAWKAALYQETPMPQP
jgi:uncharacterized protein (TIGR02246 family)